MRPGHVLGLPALGAGFIGASLGLMPTGNPIADNVWSALFTFSLAILLFRGSLRSWIVLACLAATAGSAILLLVAGGIGGVSLGFLSRDDLSSRPYQASTAAAIVSALVGSVGAIVALALPDYGRAGLSAVIVAILWIGLAIGEVRRFERDRIGLRPMYRVGALVVCFGVLGVGVFATVTARSVNNSYGSAEQYVLDSIADFRNGEIDQARSSVEAARDALAEGRGQLNGSAAVAFEWLPIAGPNIKAVRTVGSSAEDSLATLDRAMRLASATGEIVEDGRISLDRITDVAAGLGELGASISKLDAKVDSIDSTWIIPPLRKRLDVLAAELGPAAQIGEEFGELDSIAAAILGGDGSRQYLVLFGNPAEARELGGFTGGTAVLRLDAGTFEILAADRNGILNQRPTTSAILSSSLPARYLEHRPWEFAQNYTAAADLPTIGAAMADIFPEVGGQHIDGVMYVDPIALDAIVSMTGPIEVDGFDESQLRPGQVTRFLTREQYETFAPKGSREEFFAAVGEATFAALARGDYHVDSADFGRMVAMVAEGRITFAPLDSAELDVARALGAAGDITKLSPGTDYLAVSHLNGGPNKLDSYLHRNVVYDVSLNADSIAATATITLENTAPADLTDYVESNGHGYAPGSNRITLVVHTPHELIGWSGDDVEPELTRSYREFDRWRHERIVVIPRGESRQVTIELMGSFTAEARSDESYRLALDSQPLIHADDFRVHVTRGPDSTQESFRLRRDIQLTMGFDADT